MSEIQKSMHDKLHKRSLSKPNVNYLGRSPMRDILANNLAYQKIGP